MFGIFIALVFLYLNSADLRNISLYIYNLSRLFLISDIIQNLAFGWRKYVFILDFLFVSKQCKTCGSVQIDESCYWHMLVSHFVLAMITSVILWKLPHRWSSNTFHSVCFSKHRWHFKISLFLVNKISMVLQKFQDKTN